jgi:predicted DNA binding CopG/RHH family protein
MAKKYSESSQRAVRVRKSAKPMQVEQIDFSDIPESTDEELSRARRVGRPKSGNAKQLIAIRISPRLLAQLRRLAAKRDKPYQTLIHELLEKAARKSNVA